ncbi:hydantoinase B/oxoprolinase family protein (plasmid) [Agrobacterium tumefaciens]|uniref:Hydantoinase B/oxoprolinase family protein n=1 Tax=Agrobacterium tumefaciens TaxID=358 RepID=A0AAJ4TDL6_AGRTU|nr:hydantoinase B/oxoprolinase family protein [Agrobacterium tumefaciens]
MDKPVNTPAGVSVDPVTLEIVRNALTSIAERNTHRMIRASTSIIVKEMEDCSAAVFDGKGRLLAESATIPIHLNCTGVCLRTILEHYHPAETWRPGDIVITNDPYAGGASMSTAHTNDYVVFMPVFYEEVLVGFTGLMVHHQEIGAMNMATRGWNIEIWQEGLRVPPMKIGENGIVEDRCMRIILNNTRLPDSMENDLLAQIASVAAASDDMHALFSRYGRETLLRCFEALIDYSEQRTRAEIAQIPDGVYEHEELILDDGAKGGPYKLKLAIHKTGSDILFDFTGTDPQIRGPINAPLATTWAAIFYAMRCVTDPSIPSTEGNKRPFKVIAPEGTLVNAKKPAAVYQRMVVCHSLVDLVMGALAQIVPERVMGDSCGCLYNFTSARERGTGNQSVFGEVVPGGLGATSRADGIDVMSCHVTNCPIPPIEATEAECPVLYVQRELQTGTGGAGKWRGGVGQVLAYKILGDLAELQHTSQKSVTLPQGVAGGLPGGGGRWVINEGQPNARVLEHSIGELEMLDYGDIVTHYTPGGGGFGNPLERDPALVLRDVRTGLVTLEQAETIYGIKVTGTQLSDWAPAAGRDA